VRHFLLLTKPDHESKSTKLAFCAQYVSLHLVPSCKGFQILHCHH